MAFEMIIFRATSTRGRDGARKIQGGGGGAKQNFFKWGEPLFS
jgi:hypothetical protein